MKNRYNGSGILLCLMLAPIFVVSAGYDYHREEARAEKNSHLASQASAQWREAKALKRQAQATSAQNRLIAALAVCAGATVAAHVTTAGRDTRVQIGAGVLTAGACLPAVNEVRKVLKW